MSTSPQFPGFGRFARFQTEYPWLIPVLTGISGVILTLVLWRFTLNQNRSTDEARFADLSDRVIESIRNRLSDHQQVLTGLKGLFAASENVQRDEFRAYVNTMRLEDTPGAMGFGFIRYLRRENLEQFLRTTRADHAPNFSYRSAGDRPDLLLVEFIEPFAVNGGMAGLDLGVGQLQRDAATAAVDHDRETLSRPIHSTIDDQERIGFLLLLPIYANGAPVTTSAERWRALRGWVYTPLVMEELIRDIAAVSGNQIDFEIFDEDDHSRASLLYDSDGHLLNGTEEKINDTVFFSRPLHRQASVSLGNRTWKLHISALPAFEATTEHRLPWFVLGGGLIITALASNAIGASQRARRKAVVLAQEMTVELREEIAQREQVDSELRSVSGFQSTILRSASYAIFSLTPEGIITVFNPAAEKMLGYTEAEIVGRATPALFHDPGEIIARAQTFSHEMGLTVAPDFNVFIVKSYHGLPNEHEWTYVRKDGARLPVLLSVTAVRDAGGNFFGFLAVATDITARKAHEATLLAARQAAESASHAKSEFLAVMSHEIRTPMNAVIGFTELLMDTPLQAKQRDFVEIIRSSGENLILLINDILDFSKIEAGKLEVDRARFDAVAAVELVAKTLAPQVKAKGLNLTVEVAGNLPRFVIADYSRLRQVLINLIGNALKFTAKGSVTLTVISAAGANGPALRFNVTDTGLGIPKEKQALLFQKFTQADSSITREYGGTGLGLAICKRLVELMGGQIGFTSVAGQGSTFWFELPLASDQTPPVPLRSATHSSFPFNAPAQSRAGSSAPIRHRVLVADDNPINQQLVVAFLAKLNCDTTLAHHGAEAVGLVQSQPFDVVLMDHQMPVMDGCEATKVIRAWEQEQRRPARLPIIALTANATESGDAFYHTAGMDGYLSKPLIFAELKEMLRTLLGIGEFPSAGASAAPALPAAPASAPETVALRSSPEPAPIMNRALALELTDHNATLLGRLAKAFVPQSAVLVPAIRQAIAQRDLTTLTEHAHKLKGTVTLFAAPAVTANAEALEHPSTPPDWPALETQGAQLEANVHRLLAELAALESNPAAAPTAA